MSRSDPSRVRVGLALAGGGGRGLAHVGVLKVLEAEDVPIDLIAGTSIGAIVGAMYACEPDAAVLEERILEFIESRAMKRLGLGTMERLRGLGKPGEETSDERPESGERRDSGEPPGSDEPDGLFARWQRKFRQLYASHRAMTRIAMLPGEAMTEALDGLYSGCTFEDLKLPFAAVAVDIHAGQEVIITHGSLAEAVAASAALAGIFPPVELAGRTLIDGGYVSPVPVETARTLGANVVLAVDVSMTGRESGTFPSAVEVAMRAGEISRAALEREQLRHADVVIPARFAERHWSDFSVAQEAIVGGEKAARNLLDSIRSAIDERSRLFI